MCAASCPCEIKGEKKPFVHPLSLPPSPHRVVAKHNRVRFVLPFFVNDHLRSLIDAIDFRDNCLVICRRPITITKQLLSDDLIVIMTNDFSNLCTCARLASPPSRSHCGCYGVEIANSMRCFSSHKPVFVERVCVSGVVFVLSRCCVMLVETQLSLDISRRFHPTDRCTRDNACMPSDAISEVFASSLALIRSLRLYVG